MKGEIKRDILKRLIINDEFGRSWTFKMFKGLPIMAAPKKKVIDLMPS